MTSPATQGRVRVDRKCWRWMQQGNRPRETFRGSPRPEALFEDERDSDYSVPEPVVGSASPDSVHVFETGFEDFVRDCRELEGAEYFFLKSPGGGGSF